MSYTQLHMGSFDQAPSPGIYHPDTVSPRDKQLLEETCKPSHWDWQRLRQVLIALGVLGPGHYIPAAHRPDSIHIAGFRPTIDYLMKKSAQEHAETSTVWFADRQRQCLVRSGIISVGTYRHTKLDVQPEPGREHVQHLIASFHTHPREASHAFSPADYAAFLKTRGYVLQVVAHEVGVIIAAKTSVTPLLTPERIDTRLALMSNEFGLGSSPTLEDIMNMNKVICTEFGLTLYFAPTQSRDLATRVEVTK